VGERVLGYGELWEDRALDEAELARLVIAPDERGRGQGRAMTKALAGEAKRRGFAEVWLRVRPENTPARRAYEASGFRRATSDEEAEFNAGQPHDYVWMRHSA
jgi:ribosomal protein S18 acetylase RimI-like enzyme